MGEYPSGQNVVPTPNYNPPANNFSEPMASNNFGASTGMSFSSNQNNMTFADPGFDSQSHRDDLLSNQFKSNMNTGDYNDILKSMNFK